MFERDRKPSNPQNPEPQQRRDEATEPIIPPRPETSHDYEVGEVLMAMIARYGEEQRLPEALTNEIFKAASPDLTAQVSPERLGQIAFNAMFMWDANAHLNEGMAKAEPRDQIIRRFAENMLSNDIERNGAD